MKNLMNYRGEVKQFVEVFDKFVIMSNVQKEFNEQDIPHTIYFNHNDQVAIMCGYYNLSTMQENKEQFISLVNENIVKYCSGIKSNIEDCSISKDVYKCDFEYITKLCDVSVDSYNNFIISYEDHQYHESLRIKKEREEKESLQKEREEKYVLDVIKKIKNDEKVSGRDLIDIAESKGIKVAIRTKGLILRCFNINSKTLNFEGKKPQNASNVFNLYNQVKEILNETI